MGFSVSGSAAIIFLAMFIAFGTFYSATSNSMEQINDARSAEQDRLLTQENTQIDDLNATHNATRDTLVVTVNNTGSTTLEVSKTDLLVDNDYQTAFIERSVEGDTNTDLWAPGDQLQYNVTSTQPDRVKIVTGPGISDTVVVTSG